jgi:glutamyl-tRNA synthetase
MEITSVIRGDDLLSSTPRQLALYQALGLPPPRFAHVPLVLTPGGERLAKRTRPPSLADLRQRAADPAMVVGVLAASARLCPPGSRLMPRDLIPGFALARVPKTPVTLPEL